MRTNGHRKKNSADAAIGVIRPPIDTCGTGNIFESVCHKLVRPQRKAMQLMVLPREQIRFAEVEEDVVEVILARN